MVESERKHVVARLEGGKIDAIGGLLETHELQHPMRLIADLLIHLRQTQHIGVAKIGLDGCSCIGRLADISENQFVNIAYAIGKPTDSEAVQSRFR